VPSRIETVIRVRIESPAMRADATLFASIALSKALYVSVCVEGLGFEVFGGCETAGQALAGAPCTPTLSAATRAGTSVSDRFTGPGFEGEEALLYRQDPKPP
jgi:hypothetical protein